MFYTIGRKNRLSWYPWQGANRPRGVPPPPGIVRQYMEPWEEMWRVPLDRKTGPPCSKSTWRYLSGLVEFPLSPEVTGCRASWWWKVIPPLSWCCVWLGQWPACSQALPTTTWWLPWRLKDRPSVGPPTCIQLHVPQGDPFCCNGNNLTHHFERALRNYMKGGESFILGSAQWSGQKPLGLVVPWWAKQRFLP